MASEASSPASRGVKGFRFRRSGASFLWREGMDSISPYLAAMARKVEDPEGSSVEVDASGHILVDDSNYSSQVIGVLVLALKGERLDLGELEVGDLLEYLRCADFFQLLCGFYHQVYAALWAKLSSHPAESSAAVMSFKEFNFTEPCTLDALNLQNLSIQELVLHNVAIKGNASFMSLTLTDSSLALGLGGELTATQTVFKGCKLIAVCTKAIFESCAFHDSRWEGPAGQPEALIIKNGQLSGTHFPSVHSMTLESVSMTDCELQKVGCLTIKGNCSFAAMRFPSCSHLSLSGHTRCSIVLGGAESISLTDVDGVRLDVCARGSISFTNGPTCLKECRLRQDQNTSSCISAPVVAIGCVFRGMTFPLMCEPLSFKQCTFYRCTFQARGSGLTGHCVIFDNCALILCSTCLYGSQRNATLTAVSATLAKNFHTLCQVVADISELPESLPASHLEWICAA